MSCYRENIQYFIDALRRIHAKIIEWEHRLKIHYRISDDASGRKLTTGHTVQVAVDIRSGELQFETPPVLRRKLGLL